MPEVIAVNVTESAPCGMHALSDQFVHKMPIGRSDQGPDRDGACAWVRWRMANKKAGPAKAGFFCGGSAPWFMSGAVGLWLGGRHCAATGAGTSAIICSPIWSAVSVTTLKTKANATIERTKLAFEKTAERIWIFRRRFLGLAVRTFG